MTPTEELFHLTEDPREMSNVATDPRRTTALESLRGAYDAQLELLRQRVNPVHDYARYAILFDRSVPWSRKATLIPRIQPGSEKSN